MLVTFEGPEGAGKSTQARRLAASLVARGLGVVEVREPGGTALGETIRELLLRAGDTETPTDRAEAALFAAARAQLVERVIRPALARGEVVIADRFGDSSLAYQSGGRGLPPDEVAALVRFATDGLAPDLTFLLDVDVASGFRRKAGAGDRLEQEDVAFHERVRRAYLALAAEHPDRVVVFDATRPTGQLAEEILGVVLGRLETTSPGEGRRRIE